MVSRLLCYGNEFRKNDNSWVHYKHKEDWDKVYELPFGTDRNKIVLVYSKGRDMAIYMGSELASINDDYTTYLNLLIVGAGRRPLER